MVSAHEQHDSLVRRGVHRHLGPFLGIPNAGWFDKPPIFQLPEVVMNVLERRIDLLLDVGGRRWVLINHRQHRSGRGGRQRLERLIGRSPIEIENTRFVRG